MHDKLAIVLIKTAIGISTWATTVNAWCFVFKPQGDISNFDFMANGGYVFTPSALALVVFLILLRQLKSQSALYGAMIIITLINFWILSEIQETELRGLRDALLRIQLHTRECEEAHLR